jgi:adenylosuccinate lyase
MSITTNITDLFTKKNLEILDLLYREPHGLHLRDIAARLDCSPAKVHNSLKLFKKNELVIEQEVKNKRVVKANKDNILFRKIEQLLYTDLPENEKEESIPLFECISPLDYRYYGRNKKIQELLGRYLSEEAFVSYQARVELALIRALAKLGVCPPAVEKEVFSAIRKVRAQEVYKEEDRIKHNIRALVNQIRNNVSEQAKPYVHFTTTSFDIFDTANALRFKEVAEKVVMPELLKLEKTLINLAMREKDTLQIGRTHGQHAEPITFGFTISSYVSRVGSRILAIKRASKNLRGKISGAVGAYNASSLFFKDPEKLEHAILNELNLKSGTQSSQIVEPEWVTDYMHTIVSTFSVLANLADDMRALQRSEINEIAESFEKKQVGSSTMPHKRNPINFENVKSMWKQFMPRMNTVYLDQISEHQRDLTNSASQRFLPEIVAGLVVSTVRLNKVMSNLVVDKDSLKKNFDKNKEMIAAEPAYILLAAQNHPDAHEAVRELTLESQSSSKTFTELFFDKKELHNYIKKFNKKQIDILKNPEQYTGIASKKAEHVCKFWKKELNL